MNKWQIICPVVAMALVAFLGLIIYSDEGRIEYRAYINAQTAMIGQELVSTTNSPRLVRIDPALRNRLSSFLVTQSGVAEVLFGDEPQPLGDGTACSRLVLSNATGSRLGIRLRQDPKPDRFHILGCWPITNSSAATPSSH